ncbi:hypothetical protein MAHJHV33_49930 [Mycobacterium avium subsp. hominissuis]
MQGLSMTIGWPDLAEAALAIRAAASRSSAGAGLPATCGVAPALLRDAAARGDFRAPLVIGDRLDTDIEGANAAGRAWRTPRLAPS